MSSSNSLINGGVSPMFHNQFCKWTVNGWWMDAKHLVLGVFLWPLRGFKVAMAACEKMARWQQLLTLLTEMFGPRCLVLCGCFFPFFSSGFEPDTHQSFRRTSLMVANARSPTALVEFVPLKAANAMHDMVKYDDIELHRTTWRAQETRFGGYFEIWAADDGLPINRMGFGPKPAQSRFGHSKDERPSNSAVPKRVDSKPINWPISGQALENLQGSFYSYECLMVPISNIFSIVIYKERHVITAVGLDLWDGCKPLRIAAAAAATFGGPQLFFSPSR